MVKFGFTLNKLKIVMSILDRIQGASSSSKQENYSLEKHEIEFILLLIKDSVFKGEHVETLYNVVLKLQNQYTNK